MNLKKLFTWFYPGSLWKKRIGHLLVLTLIGINLLVNQLSNRAVETADYWLAYADTLTQKTEYYANKVEKKTGPWLNWIRDTKVGQTLEKYGMKYDSTSLVNDLTPIHKTRNRIIKYVQTIYLISWVLWIVEMIMWIGIAWSSLWLLCDFLFQPGVRLFLLVGGVLAVTVSLISYLCLQSFLF